MGTKALDDYCRRTDPSLRDDNTNNKVSDMRIEDYLSDKNLPEIPQSFSRKISCQVDDDFDGLDSGLERYLEDEIAECRPYRNWRE